ncbi:four helix bundle protein [Candidatus Saccharibacteria bacterium]|nr:four helix bundle protein [Candidatus Saccharibacteria bacterium]
MAERITSFRDLKTWQEAQDLAVEIYKLSATFPESEKFGLTNQMRRAGVSVGSNIAEGFSRQTAKEKSQYYYIAKGSLTEVESQIDLAMRVGYLDAMLLEALVLKIEQVGRLLTALIRNIPVR